MALALKVPTHTGGELGPVIRADLVADMQALQDATLHHLGAYDVATVYAINDVTTFGGASYLAIQAGVGVAPVAGGNATWTELAAKGAQGVAGASGPQGPAGAQGPAGQDTVLTAADRAQTGLDAAATSADAASTAADRVAVAADKTATANDRAAADAAKIGAQTAEANAVAVVSGGTASLPPAPGLIPLADANGEIAYWLQKGLVGNVSNPGVQLLLNQLKMIPFASAAYSTGVASADVTSYSGLLRTMTLNCTLPAGVAASSFALIGGIYYPIISVVAGTSFTVEYDSDDADPAASTSVIFCLWRMRGDYRGELTYTSTSRVNYLHPTKNKLRTMPAGFPAFTKMSDGSIGLQHEGLSRTNSIALLNYRDITSWTLTGMTAVADAVGVDGVVNAAHTITDTDAGNVRRAQPPSLGVPDDTKINTSFVMIKKGSAVNIPAVYTALTGGANAVQSFTFIDTATGLLSADSPATSYVEDFGGFWKVTVALTNNGTGNTVKAFQVYPCYRATLNGATDNTLTTSVVIDWAQVELDSSGLSASAIVGGATRNAQALTAPLENLPKRLEPFSFVVDVEFNGKTGASQEMLRTGGEVHRILRVDSLGRIVAYYGTSPIVSGVVIVPSEKYRVEMKYDGANHQLWINGVLAVSAPPANMTGIMSNISLFLGCLCRCSRIAIYRPGLTSSESAAV